MPIQIGHRGDHGFDEPLGLLSDCHRRIERFLRALLTVSRDERGRPLSAVGRRALVQASTYFRTAAPLHTADEEHGLFPLLRASSNADLVAVIAELDSLESDHRRAEVAHARVDVLVGRWLELQAAGLPPEAADELIALLESLEELYAKHIAFEDRQVFPAAGSVLAAEQLEVLGREMAERRGLPHRGPITRFLSSDHERLHALLAATLDGTDEVRMEPFEQFRAGILRHIAMEEKLLIPRATAALGGERPAIAALLRIDHGAIAALLVPPPTREIVTELRSILARHDRCEEESGGLYEICDNALGVEASLGLVAELREHLPVLIKPYKLTERTDRHMRESVARSWEAWKAWSEVD